MKIWPAVVLLFWTAGAANAAADAAAHKADLDWLVDQIGAHYAYLPERHLDLAKLRRIYEPQAEAAANKEAWLHVVERVIGELHDHHATLGANAPSSPQLVPTGTDLWGEMQSGQAVLTEVRIGSPAEQAGLKAGDVVVAINGVPVTKAIAAAGPRALAAPDAEAANFTLRTLLAGTHDRPRRMLIRDAQGHERNVVLPAYLPPQADALVSWKWLDAKTGYIRIENSLGDSGTVAAFDAALDKLRSAKSLVFDLRNTPSGGDSDVAEPILGRFIAQPAGYQRVFNPGPGKQFPKDSWLKPVKPRGPYQVTTKLVVMVDHWTGSMGEGMSIGLDALHRATVVGTPMARLCGGTGEFKLPQSGITVHFPIERLYHVDGRPRESFVPPVNVDLRHATGKDAILAAALARLR